jgi:hypothetical protein
MTGIAEGLVDEAHEVAGQRLGLEQLQTQVRTRHRLWVVAAFQGVARPLAGKAPFLRNTTDSREREVPRWQSIALRLSRLTAASGSAPVDASRKLLGAHPQPS